MDFGPDFALKGNIFCAIFKNQAENQISRGKKYMIVFDLKCGNGHCFEGWFEDSGAYEEQKEKSLISCPVCDDKNITKILSTFALKSYRDPAPTADSESLASKEGRIIENLKKIQGQLTEFVEKNFEDVGCDFAKEALKIHYGVSEPRNIRGVSTEVEEKTLKEEGVKFIKFPMPAPPKTDS